jgi:hypothetical protein
MRLIDIILESDAAEEARRMGLVKKRGVGLYGPPGDENPASHRIRGGKLTALKSHNSGPTQSASSSTARSFVATTDTEKAAAGKPKPSSRRHEIPRPPSPNIDEVAQRLRESFSPNDIVDDVEKTLSVVTSAFGRQTAPPVHEFSPEFYSSSGLGEDIFRYIYGIYVHSEDVIGVKHSIPTTPVSEWETSELISFSVHVHESLHAARYEPDSRQPDFPDSWKRHKSHRLIDEGMTEYLTQEIVKSTLGDSPQRELYESYGGEYRAETRATRLMVEHGGLDVTTTFMNMSYSVDEETGEVAMDFIQDIRDAHEATFTNSLEKIGATERETEDIMSRLQQIQDLGDLPLYDPDIGDLLMKLAESDFDPTRPPLRMSREIFVQRLSGYLYTALRKAWNPF